MICAKSPPVDPLINRISCPVAAWNRSLNARAGRTKLPATATVARAATASPPSAAMPAAARNRANHILPDHCIYLFLSPLTVANGI